MKKKFILPIIALGLFMACSDNSNTNTVNVSADDPSGESVTGSSDSGDPGSAKTGQESSASTEPESSTEGGEGGTTPGTTTESSPSEGGTTTPSSNSAPATPTEPVRVEINNTIPNNSVTEVGDYDNYKYFGAELSGRNQFTYGRFEARMKMVSVSGSVSSMFLYYDPSYKLGSEPWNEIDIEVLGTNPGSWQSNLITRYPDEEGKKNQKIFSEYVTGFGFNSTEDFHLFAFIWTPEYISWEIDSVEIRRDVLGMDKGQVEYMTLQQTLRFNLWASNTPAWTGKFTGAELASGPVAQEIDYVRIYNYDKDSKTFSLAWQDDFDGTTLNTSRWSKGNWEMERVMLSPDNVVVEDGKCKLLLSRVAK